MSTTPKAIRAAAVQTEARLGDVDANLADCARLADQAVRAGATWVVLPEFFSTGIGYLPELSARAPDIDGEPTRLLAGLATRHGIHVGGSTLVRDPDGEVRNAFLLFGPDGLAGRHDKDLPTMWESALYTGGRDPGRLDVAGTTVGVALCWELMRSQTVARLGGEVDLVVGGSGWWSLPEWPLLGGAERRNHARATAAPATFARYVGAPVVHAAHAGRVECDLLGTPLRYRGRLEGGAQICDSRGRVLAYRDRDQGAGVVLADVTLGRTTPTFASDRFWLQRRGAVAAAAWHFHNAVGRRAYARAQQRHHHQPEESTR
ncbi:carbon-nitrogen hydrolase family protein [Pimelobacter simplex]|uniref:Carbon-nitrogen hydrolase family protein n=1 Tax=Nocardioides simplex TaxID=2045 RepID=A0A7J5DTN9_NOCSI|nr:carbon-nitrogen hydrolase family protein [Pimelobacter simplex]KAB2808497.1 carbon-nitrogen hydrolase family protein [Pimelobacter simplex]